jgi:transaldolase
VDYIRRDFILGVGVHADTSLLHIIDNDGLAGMTSNPSIFEKTILDNNDYDQT